MSTPETNDHVDMAGYLMDMLAPQERQRADEHLRRCTDCRTEIESLKEWSSALTAIDDAMLMDGPPEDADLVLQRTLRQVRQESARDRRNRFVRAGATAAAVVLLAMGVGIWAGRGTAPAPLAQPTAPANARMMDGTDAVTNVRMRAAVTPAAGWVRVSVTVSGIPAGQKCLLEVVGKDGVAVQAGSWLVSEAGEAAGTMLNGTALVAPADVAAVRVVNTEGKVFVNVKA